MALDQVVERARRNPLYVGFLNHGGQGFFRSNGAAPETLENSCRYVAWESSGPPCQHGS